MTMKKLSRRDFLKLSGLALGGAAAACSGLGYAATQSPKIATPELVFTKDNSMNKRLLVTYATRAGSTPEIAAAIGETLAARGFSVEVKPVKTNPPLAGYGAVILGSAIRIGNWLPEMVDFIKKNQAALAQMPLAMFTVHMLNLGEDEASRAARVAYTAPIHQLLTPVDEVFFAGKIDYATLSFFDRLMAMAVEKQTGAATGDRRDWEQIRAWAEKTLA